MKKYINNILVLLSALLAVSCSGFLDEEPITFVSPDTYYQTEEEMQDVVNGCYAGLDCIFSGLIGIQMNAHVLFEGLTGNSERMASGSLKSMGYELPMDVTSDGINLNLWSGYYVSIENCNSTIDALEKNSAGVNQSTVNGFLSEVYFLRAYYYWRLATIFGDVPYKTEKTTSANNASISKTPVAEVIDGVITDLTRAEELSADEAWTRSDGHVSKGAIKSLLAKVYLTKAGYPIQDSASYALAYAKAKEVYDSGAYSLFGSYADLIDQTKENSGEFVFTIQREAEHASNPVTDNCMPSTTPVIAAAGNLGDAAFVPTLQFYNSFDDTDARKTAWFYTSYKALNSDEIVHFSRPYVYKFFDASNNSLQNQKNGLDYTVIRYADVLLTLAEAKVGADGGSTTDPTAIDAYYQVHHRAFSSATAPASLDFDTVFKERVKELCFENQTWFDMTRTRKAYNPLTDSVVDMIGFAAAGHPTGAFTTNDLYLPIPLRERRLNPNL